MDNRDPQPLSPQRLDYRRREAEPKSQWLTDEHAGGFWIVGCLVGLTALGAVGGLVWGVVSLLAGC